MNPRRKTLKASRIRPVERPERRTGVEVAKPEQNAAKAKVKRISLIVIIGRAVRLMLAGWVPTELGLWMKRTKWDGGSITETYNLTTAYQKQFEPGRTNPNQ